MARFNKGDICSCVIDYEYGTGAKARPVVFWDNWDEAANRPTVLVIPLTSVSHKTKYQPSLEILRTPENNLTDDSVLKLYQFACVSKNNLGHKIGRLARMFHNLPEK